MISLKPKQSFEASNVKDDPGLDSTGTEGFPPQNVLPVILSPEPVNCGMWKQTALIIYVCSEKGRREVLDISLTYKTFLPLLQTSCLDVVVQEVTHLYERKKDSEEPTFRLSFISFLLSKPVLHKRDDLPLGDGCVVSETLTGTTGMTWCLAHLIRILIGVCRRGSYKW